MPVKRLEHKLPGEFLYREVVYATINNGIDINLVDAYKPDPMDVLIASYPKTGTTWMSVVVNLILNDGEIKKVEVCGPANARRPYLEMTFHPTMTSIENVISTEVPRTLRTHLRYEFLDGKIEDEKLKTIVMFRNPKDTFVSYYHFYCNSAVLGNFKGSFHEWFELAKVGHLHYGDLFEWYKDWWMQKDQGNIMVGKYEDMIKDPIGLVNQVAKFCNKQYNEDTIRGIVEECSFSQMKKQNHTTPNFFRKGEVGDWKNTLTREESEWIDEKCKEILTPIGLTFEY